MDRPPVTRLLSAVEGFLYQDHLDEARSLLESLKMSRDTMTGKEQAKQRFLTARLAEEEGDLDGALQSYNELLRENPLDADSLLAAGYVLQKRMRFDEALVFYERAARISPEHEAASLIRQAQIAVEREDYARAESLLERAQEIKHEEYIERYLEQVREMLE
jgi:tetratricopeptide (TPR) repeat protein